MSSSSFMEWTLGAFRSPTLWVPLALFTVLGVVMSVLTLPPDVSMSWKLLMGVTLGLFSFMFPYCNRLMDEDWVP